MIGIWIDGRNPHVRAEFVETANNFGILTWEFEEPSSSVDFLDLNITIEALQIITKTHQKSMNLYQYLLPHSAHPLGTM